MAHRSDRRGDTPSLGLATAGRNNDWHPRAHSPSWPGAVSAPRRGRRYDCSLHTVLPFPTIRRLLDHDMPNRAARVKVTPLLAARGARPRPVLAPTNVNRDATKASSSPK